MALLAPFGEPPLGLVRQQADPAGISTRYLRRAWTTEDGLPQNSVTAIVQTRDAYLWLGTLGGLARFDGVAFTVFNTGNTPGLESNRILSLYEARDGTLWIGTETGQVMALRGGKASSYGAADGLPGGLVWSFHEDPSGTLWIGSTRGLTRWRPAGSTTTTYTTRDGLPGDRVWAIEPHEEAGLWLGTDGGLCRFDGVRCQFRAPGGALPAAGVRVLRRARDGGLWLGTSEGLDHLGGGEWTPHPRVAGPSRRFITALAQDTEGNVWAGYFEGGVLSLQPAGVNAPGAATLDLGDHVVRALHVDREGNLWLGTMGGGLMRLQKRRLLTYSREEGLPDDAAKAITGDGAGGVWIATGAGLAHVPPGPRPKVRSLSVKDGLPHGFVEALHRDRQGALWMGAGGLVRFKDGRFTFRSPGAPSIDAHVHAIAEDPQGTLWVATEEGLGRYRDGRWANYRVADGLVHDDVRCLLPAGDGSLWVGTVGGLSRLAGGAFTNYTSRHGLSNDYVRTMVADEDGSLWLGTYGGGLARLRDGRFARVTAKDGLFDDFISQILADGGRFWMLSNRGVFHVSRQELRDLADGRRRSISSTSYGVADGMKSSEGNGGNQPAGWRGEDGRLWFATIKGVVAVDPNPPDEQPPPVLIERVLLDGEAVPPGEEARVNPGRQSLEIRYTALALSRPEQVRFRYRLAGLEEAWIDAGSRRTAYYSHLPPGRYRFEVIAANGDGIWNTAGASLAVVVVPPLWRTGWFQGLLALGLAGALALAYRRRIAHLRRAQAAREEFSRLLMESQERERQRIAAELHDSLGQSLLVIKNSAFLAVESRADGRATRAQLENVMSSAAQAIDEVREIAYNLRPPQLERFGLTRTLQALLARCAESSALHLAADIDPLDGLFSRDEEISVYRILQESLNNTLKHAHARRAGVRIKREGQEVVMRIQDDGGGFDPPSAAAEGPERAGFGLRGMAERARLLGGTLLVESAPGGGTTLTVRLQARRAHP